MNLFEAQRYMGDIIKMSCSFEGTAVLHDNTIMAMSEDNAMMTIIPVNPTGIVTCANIRSLKTATDDFIVPEEYGYFYKIIEKYNEYMRYDDNNYIYTSHIKQDEQFIDAIAQKSTDLLRMMTADVPNWYAIFPISKQITKVNKPDDIHIYIYEYDETSYVIRYVINKSKQKISYCTYVRVLKTWYKSISSTC